MFKKSKMPTQTKENYLKALFHLHLKNEEISLSELGKEMGVSKPTANDMVKKLHQRKWLVYEKYKPLRLTMEGLKMAALVIRKHRLAEMFLQKIMSFGWEEVHEIAEELEHMKSEKFFDRMDEILGFPKQDPHGSPIPNKEGVFDSPDYEVLSQVKEGNSAVIRALRESSSEFIEYLNKLDIKLGNQMELIRYESFDGSYLVKFNDQEPQVLTDSVCRRLLVEVL